MDSTSRRWRCARSWCGRFGRTSGGAGPRNAAARVAISGIDDGRSPGGVVRTAVPAGAPRDFAAADLESGEAEGLSGALGNGAGEWRLRVESDGDVYAVSLAESSIGHLENVSR